MCPGKLTLVLATVALYSAASFSAFRNPELMAQGCRDPGIARTDLITEELAKHLLSASGRKILIQGMHSSRPVVYLVLLEWAVRERLFDSHQALALVEGSMRTSRPDLSSVDAEIYWRILCDRAHQGFGAQNLALTDSGKELFKSVVAGTPISSSAKKWIHRVRTSPGPHDRERGWGFCLRYSKLGVGDRRWLLREAEASKNKAKGVEVSFMQFVERNIRLKNPGRL